MEPLVHTWTVNEQVASADLNQIQENAVASRPAVGTATNDWSAIDSGTQEVLFQGASAFANATVHTIDTSIDWRDRFVRGTIFTHGAANSQPGGVNDTNFNSGAGTYVDFAFYTGTGATDGAAALVTNGNPPALGYFFDPITNLYVFCDPNAGGGKLRVYNATGGAVNCLGLFIRASRDLGKR